MVGKDNQEIVSVRISAEFESLEQIKKIFNGIEKDKTIQLCDENLEFKLLAAGDTLSFGGGFEAEILISFSLGVASGVVGNIIYNAICTGIKKLEINGRRTRITEENITQAIETIKRLVEEKNCSDETSDEHK